MHLSLQTATERNPQHKSMVFGTVFLYYMAAFALQKYKNESFPIVFLKHPLELVSTDDEGSE